MKNSVCALCQSCKNLFHPADMVRLSLRNRGERVAFLCVDCLNEKQDASAINATIRGKRKVNGFIFAVEHDTSETTEKAHVELANFGFTAHETDTADTEWKSAVYEGFNALSKQCVSIERLYREKEMQAAKDSDTRLYIGHIDHTAASVAEMVNTYYTELFGGLIEAMKENATGRTRAFLGKEKGLTKEMLETPLEMVVREFEGKPVVMFGFNNSRFRNAAQYQAFCRFAKDVVNAIINNFIEHYNGNPNGKALDATRYKSLDAYRAQKAKVTANKLIRHFNEYIND